MPITEAELQRQTESLIKMVMLNTPKNVGAIVVFIDNESGLLCCRAMRLTVDKTKETFTALLHGYGRQVVTEGVDLVKPS